MQNVRSPSNHELRNYANIQLLTTGNKNEQQDVKNSIELQTKGQRRLWRPQTRPSKEAETGL